MLANVILNTYRNLLLQLALLIGKRPFVYDLTWMCIRFACNSFSLHNLNWIDQVHFLEECSYHGVVANWPRGISCGNGCCATYHRWQHHDKWMLYSYACVWEGLESFCCIVYGSKGDHGVKYPILM